MIETHFDESYSSRLKLQSGGLGAEPPAAEGQRGCCGDFTDFSQKFVFLGIFWFLNDCIKCFDAPPRTGPEARVHTCSLFLLRH